jgi:hypothetical protein
MQPCLHLLDAQTVRPVWQAAALADSDLTDPPPTTGWPESRRRTSGAGPGRRPQAWGVRLRERRRRARRRYPGGAQNHAVVGERLVQGRRGEACRDLEQVAATRKGCAVTRSFSDPGRRLARSRPSSASQNRCRWPRPSVARACAPSARNSGRPSSRPAHGSGA